MISVEEAIEHLAAHPISCQTESVPLDAAFGRVLAEPLLADRDFPPFDRVAMDGIAFSHAYYASGQMLFLVEAVAAAGQPPYQLQKVDNCVEVMTGAVLPEGCDTVVRYEDLSIQDNRALVQIPAIEKGANVHNKGSDRKAGSSIVTENRQLWAPELGIAATVGQNKLKVFKIPKVCLVSTGDELVPIESSPQPHQIRSSNVYALQAALSAWSTSFHHRHISDDADAVVLSIQKLLEEFQIIIFIGGSSMGKFDFIPETLRAAGVEEHFYKISQRPGKPMWFGSRENQFVFALPGNPVSSFLCVEKYVKWWMDKSLNVTMTQPSAVLSSAFIFKPNLTYFLQVKLRQEAGVLYADPLVGGGSGDHANLAEVDAFLELPMDRQEFKQGESFPVYRFRY